ncbi:YqhG family protein [Falsibacillus pallidus]|uniref:Uncharacterized protein YqhG n=1 Tax=Falsibacillus pallidus TaxID=493781 RepID=A0A370GDK4_9BACI|nr:YqhG family protein [Falsibacillus pallidus]RDI41169.1 uncharacterized protein YqhG [Falsibacillus pallidus]
MQQQEIHQFLEQYFLANKCELTGSGNGYLEVQLTIDMDKELMNRPFYWHYLEKTGGIPNPMKVSFITDPLAAPEGMKGENVHFGSPRLHQIFQSAKKLSKYVRLYEKQPAFQIRQTPLHPWLGVNMKVSFVCDRKKDVFRSFGLNLINGQLVEEFHEQVSQRPLTPKIPDFCFTLSPIIRPASGINRIQTYLENELSQLDESWGQAALKRWDEDLALLEHFYGDSIEKPESYYTEKEALKELYEPRITMEIINGGIFYLS